MIVDSDEIRQIWQRTLRPSHFLPLCGLLHKAAGLVERDWNHLAPEDRELLRRLAYESLEHCHGNLALHSNLWALGYSLFIKSIGKEADFLLCLDALDLLVDNILDAVERDDPTYHQCLLDALGEISPRHLIP